MGAASSREGLELSDSDSERSREEEEDEHYQDVVEDHPPSPSLDDIDAKLKSLKLKYPTTSASPSTPQLLKKHPNSVKLYLHIGGQTPKAKWITSEKLTTYAFVKSHGQDDSDEDEGEDDENSKWVLKVGAKVRAAVGADLQMKMYADQRRVDFVSLGGVWAIKFFSHEDYRRFVSTYQDCMFENTYGVEATEPNFVKTFGKDFMSWAKPEDADDSIWEDADDGFAKSAAATPEQNRDLREETEEVPDSNGIQSLALGALDNSFLVSNSGIQVVRNYQHGLSGKGIHVKFDSGASSRFGPSAAQSMPNKGILMRAETNMLLMSPMKDGRPHSMGLNQLDIETGKIVTNWKFEKDGTDITMRDITNDSKGAQMDPSESTFLGLDDNRLCRWDMRDRKGVVQDLATANSPVLNWTQGHQFSKGTNFQCFATTGDGSIAVGSIDGKIRLYSTTSMRQAKTAFPGLGSPITHIDVTFDGKWILGTTDTYLILICTIFTDKDGKSKTGFEGRMGNRISAPRLLKLNPLDSHLAGANNKFHGGQFSWVTENGKQERHLVATVGKFSVIWNFQQVKNSGHECYRNQDGLKSCYCYRIVLKEESIVDSRFMHEKFAVSDSPEAPLVVATPMKVSSFSISNSRR